MFEGPRSVPARTILASSLIAAAILPALSNAALAHASGRGHVMLLPTGVYLAGGAAAVAASFLVLTIAPQAMIERASQMRLVLPLSMSRGRDFVGVSGFVIFLALLGSGWWGSRDPLSNPLPLFVWTLLWAGLPAIQGLLGDVWSWISPWYGAHRLICRLSGRDEGAKPLLRLPDIIGYWPAVIQFFGFAWFELVDPAPDDPARLATVASLYFAANLAAMLVFGYEPWRRRGECLSAFFALITQFAIARQVWEAEGNRLELRWPGARLRTVPPLPADGALFLLLTLACVSFDGFSKTFFWLDVNGVNPLEFPGRSALIDTNSAGLLLMFGVLSGAFLASIFLGERLSRNRSGLPRAAGLLVWSIVPIALAYHFAHYLTAFLVNSQYAIVAISDPFDLGWNLFGTADLHVMAGVTLGSHAAWTIWNLQAGAIILGHVLAVLAAHVMAQRLYPQGRTVTVSQIPLTLLMILYTMFGLWLLSTPTGA